MNVVDTIDGVATGKNNIGLWSPCRRIPSNVGSSANTLTGKFFGMNLVFIMYVDMGTKALEATTTQA